MFASWIFQKSRDSSEFLSRKTYSSNCCRANENVLISRPEYFSSSKNFFAIGGDQERIEYSNSAFDPSSESVAAILKKDYFKILHTKIGNSLKLVKIFSKSPVSLGQKMSDSKILTFQIATRKILELVLRVWVLYFGKTN